MKKALFSLFIFLSACTSAPLARQTVDPYKLSDLMGLKVGSLTIDEAMDRIPQPTQRLERKEAILWHEKMVKTVEVWAYKEANDRNEKLISILTFFDGVLDNVTYFPKESDAVSRKRQLVEFFPNHYLEEGEENIRGQKEDTNRKFLVSKPEGIRANYEADGKHIGSITWWKKLSPSEVALVR